MNNTKEYTNKSSFIGVYNIVRLPLALIGDVDMFMNCTSSDMDLSTNSHLVITNHLLAPIRVSCPIFEKFILAILLHTPDPWHWHFPDYLTPNWIAVNLLPTYLRYSGFHWQKLHSSSFSKDVEEHMNAHFFNVPNLNTNIMNTWSFHCNNYFVFPTHLRFPTSKIMYYRKKSIHYYFLPKSSFFFFWTK